MEYCYEHTNENAADVLTVVLPKYKHNKSTKAIGFSVLKRAMGG